MPPGYLFFRTAFAFSATAANSHTRELGLHGRRLGITVRLRSVAAGTTCRVPIHRDEMQEIVEQVTSRA